MVDYLDLGEEDIYADKSTGFKIASAMKNFMIRESDAYYKVQELERQNKVIDGYEAGKGYIIKERNELMMGGFYWQGLFFETEKPKMVDQDLQNKLLVYFAPFPTRWDVKAVARMWSLKEDRWPSLIRRVANNTFVLKIADSNLMSGSFFQNTENFPDYEDKIQELIKVVAEENNVTPDHILLYGDSRGGTGALIHSLIGHYHSVIVDPILNRLVFSDGEDDDSLTDAFLPDDFVPRIESLLEEAKMPRDMITIISSHALTGNYNYLRRLDADKFRLFNLDFKIFADYNQDRQHGVFVTSGAFPLALRYMNEFLFSMDLEEVHGHVADYSQDWDVELPASNRSFNIAYEDNGLILERCGYDEDSLCSFILKEPLQAEKNYQVKIYTLESGEWGHLILHHQGGEEQVIMHPTNTAETLAGSVVTYEFETTDAWSALALDKSYPTGWQTQITNIQVEEV
jgi:hypothetical protein